MSKLKYTKEFAINQPIEILFPLFTPEGEKYWVPGWDYTNVMASKELHEDYIFLTKNHDHHSTEAIWLVKKFEPENYFVQYYKVEPKDKVGIITVICSQINGISTNIKVTYEYIGISEKGDAFIETFSADQYDEFIDEWKILLEKYFSSKK